MKAILTSAGFDNDNLVKVFHDLWGKPPGLKKALLIPTALNTPKAREYIHVFKEDLYKIGVAEANIQIYDLDYKFKAEKIIEFDVVLVCPGDPEYLMEKVTEMGFKKVLDAFQENGGVYIGISAGSDIAAGNFPDGLGYLRSSIECHAKKGSECGPISDSSDIIVKVTDNQAIVISDGDISIVE